MGIPTPRPTPRPILEPESEDGAADADADVDALAVLVAEVLVADELVVETAEAAVMLK
jgi:hypothetical protein